MLIVSMLLYVSLVYSTVHHSFGFIAGFGDRLLAEMKKLTPKDNKIRVSQLPSHDTPCKLALVCSIRYLLLKTDYTQYGWGEYSAIFIATTIYLSSV